MKALVRFILLLLFAGVSVLAGAKAASFTFVKEGLACSVFLANQSAEPIPAAANMLVGDINKVTGVTPVLVNNLFNWKKSSTCIIAGTLGADSQFDKLLKRGKVETTFLKGAWEAYRLQVSTIGKHQILFVVGSDVRGTAYGLLEISRLIGVSPWEYWADAIPEFQTTLSLPGGFVKQDKPSVQYRGLFLNDEDFALMPWVTKTLDPQSAKGAIGPKAYEKVFQLLLRLRANLIWPAMHECTMPFYQVAGNAEMARQYGIFVGTSHCEPLLRNNTGEWDSQAMGAYDYTINSENVRDYWSVRVKESVGSPCLYTVGMRGIHDGEMQGTRSLDEQKTLLEKVFADQRQILSSRWSKPASEIPQVFIPYKEVLDVYDAGLHVPDDITLMWCDDNYGNINRLSSVEEQKRSGGSGVYYHLSYWGRPHDYLWLATTSPAKIQFEMTRAWQQNARKIWVANVGDIKPGEYLTEYFLDLAWSVGKEPIVSSSTVEEPPYLAHLKAFMKREFGAEHAVRLSHIMQQFYHLADLRKPEHMGWTRVEESGYPKGRTPLIDTEFNQQEAEDRITAYVDIEKQVRYINAKLSGKARTTFYQLVFYPVVACSQQNQKILYAQMARQAEANHLSQVATSYAAASLYAYQEIHRLTALYNEVNADGKWNRMMNDHPRDLSVFMEPFLPERLQKVQPKSLLHTSILLRSVKNHSSVPDETDFQVSFSASMEQPFKQPSGLGHSQTAVCLKKGQELKYTFNTLSKGLAELRVYTLPNYAVNGGALRYEVYLNDETPVLVNTQTQGRSETWKEQVLRNQSVVKIKFNHLTPGRQTLKLVAVDDDVIFDQVMLDFNLNRKAYLVPCTE